MVIKELIKKIIPPFLLRIYHYKLALLGAVIFGFPGLLRSRASDGQGKNLIVIGVTGTSGKSTTVDFITRILEEAHSASSGQAGNKVASISSIRFKVGDKEWENKYKMTMPGRFVIQKFLRQAKKAGCKYIVLEITSEGIRQFRHKFINFDTAVFTNLTPEHIESHGSFENYRNEKLKLFRATKNIHIINISDDNADYFWNTGAKEKIGYKLKAQNVKFKTTTQSSKIIEAENIGTKDGVSFDVDGVRFNLNLIGDFNILNALAAISVAKAYGIDLEVCKRALEKIKAISGRMEIISVPISSRILDGSAVGKSPIKVIVDYAHTPEQLENVYKILTHKLINSSTHKLICVLGSCGGGRDKWKRPVLGEIAAKYCKEIIITNEDPYDEDPNQILSEIKSGISNFHLTPAGGFPVGFFPISNFHEILDRKEAIKTAIKLAKPGDVVVITGKGSEPWMCVENGKKIPWDDRQIAREAVKNM